jgi:Domain of unknown function (DUF4388)
MELNPMSQHGTATERLVNVIHSIKLGQKNGVLTVRRGEGGTLEEATVVFVSGQMTQAAVGRRSGLAAFNYLCTWMHCRYTFLPTEPGEAWPVNSFSAEQEPAATDTLSEAQHPREPNTKSLARVQMPFPGIQHPPPHLYEENNNDVAREGPGGNRIVPRSTRPLNDVLRLINQHRLSRSHRQLFLLIDGQRSMAELMFLTRRNYFEIYKLLRDLEYLGMIDIGGN